MRSLRDICYRKTPNPQPTVATFLKTKKQTRMSTIITEVNVVILDQRTITTIVDSFNISGVAAVPRGKLTSNLTK